MRALLHWVYCLPLEQAVVLALCATGVFLWLRHRFEGKKWWIAAQIGLLVCWFGVVLAETFLMGRVAGGSTVSLVPLQSYITVLQGGEQELIRSGFMNVLMFYPGALIVRSLWRRCKMGWLLLIFGGLSLTIELLQLCFGLGTFETDDLIHNTLGAFLGILAARQYEKNMQKTEAT